MNRVVADFSAESTGDKNVRLKDLRGKNVVIYFYPKDSTPGCTLEGQDFRDLHGRFKRQNSVILGVSKDSIASHEKFKAKQKFPFDLLSDPDGKLSEKFGVIREKNMYGRKFMGIERSTFVIDAEGVVMEAWRKVKAEGHAHRVAEALGL